MLKHSPHFDILNPHFNLGPDIDFIHHVIPAGLIGQFVNDFFYLLFDCFHGYIGPYGGNPIGLPILCPLKSTVFYDVLPNTME